MLNRIGRTCVSLW